MIFTHDTPAQRVLFGHGRAGEHLADEVTRLGATRVMVIATHPHPDVIGTIPVALHHDDVAPHVPVDVADRARQAARHHDIDLLVCIGGGSTTGLAKAVALTSGIPIVAVPTTYAGSEATDVWGLTEAGRKTTGVDRRVLPTTVVYDSALTVGLPVELSVASGLNALAHCVDSLWGPRADPINASTAAAGIRALNAGLPAVVEDATDRAGRDEMLLGAYLSAVAFASAGSGLHHKICHVLGGAYDLPHAQTHAVILPHVLAFNAPAAPDAARTIAAAFGTDSAEDGLARLRKRVDAPTALSPYGFDVSMIPDAVARILPVVPESNPRPVTESDLTTILTAACTGDAPMTHPQEGRR
ncbi:maleylacetate reductase [Williamsia maris]|uniref:Maleylacetate reductase n=1 Tax=Williamsia maris TaxID=72806 RepID=A0ABT1HBD6_9NOCA|nr:maleylacetate reductase [Williamsia maris]MCP2175572.1 maleylacetate reductase [Williamsia maris]